MTALRSIWRALRTRLWGHGSVPHIPDPPSPRVPASAMPPVPQHKAPRGEGSRLAILAGRYLVDKNPRRYLADAAPLVEFVSSPNQGDVFAAGRPDTILVHATGGGTAAGAIATLTDPTRKERVSGHLVIDRDGSITQLVPLDTIAWHAGKASWDGEEYVNVAPSALSWSTGATWTRKTTSSTPGARHPSAWTRRSSRATATTSSPCGGTATPTSRSGLPGRCASCSWMRSPYAGSSAMKNWRRTERQTPGPALPLDELRAQLGLPLEAVGV